MKKVISIILSAAMVMCMFVSCGEDKKNEAKGPEGTLTEIIEKIYETTMPEFGVATIDVDLADEFARKAYTGLDNADEITEAVASESMMGSQAYSLVLVRTKEGADIAKVAKAMKDGIDQRKWICVEADNIRVSGTGDVVMLVMISTELSSDKLSVDTVTDAFKTLCGGTLTVDLK